MNVKLPQFPGGEDAQFWWIFLSMLAVTGALWVVFKRRGWL
jgi:LPXTG-motif cell wall-anchored protein